MEDTGLSRQTRARLGAAEAFRDLSSAEWPKIQTCVSLLLKLLGNIEREPDNQKYKVLNLHNNRLSKDLFPVYGCENFLRSAGFRREGECLVFRDAALPISWAVEELKVFMEAETDKQRRRERDARIAKEKAEESQNRSLRPCRRALTLGAQTSEIQGGQAAEAAKGAARGDSDLDEITVNIQTLTQATPVKIAMQATLGDLRAMLAAKRACRPDQVKLALLSAAGESVQLVGDHRSLQVCEVTDNCVICVSYTTADEFQAHMSNSTQSSKRAGLYDAVDQLARETSWRFTQEILASAEVRGFLDQAAAKPLKRKMHTGEMTMKEVRDQVIAQTGLSNDGRSPFQEIIDKYLGGSTNAFGGTLQRISKTCSVAESNRKYSQMIANENARGLVEASKRMSRKSGY